MVEQQLSRIKQEIKSINANVIGIEKEVAKISAHLNWLFIIEPNQCFLSYLFRRVIFSHLYANLATLAYFIESWYWSWIYILSATYWVHEGALMRAHACFIVEVFSF